MNKADLKQVLLLVPTETERSILVDDAGIARLVTAGLRIELCGFGLVAAAILAARAIATHRPQRVILAGIAGALRTEIKTGAALEFTSVAVDGIGIGSGEGFVSAGDAGWEMFQGQLDCGERIALGWRNKVSADDSTGAGELLTVAAAAAGETERSTRLLRFPEAIAEEMEGYPVACAAASAGVPLRIVRGISNLAGDRDPGRWEVRAALQSVATLVVRICDPACSHARQSLE